MRLPDGAAEAGFSLADFLATLRGRETERILSTPPRDALRSLQTEASESLLRLFTLKSLCRPATDVLPASGTGTTTDVSGEGKSMVAGQELGSSRNDGKPKVKQPGVLPLGLHHRPVVRRFP